MHLKRCCCCCALFNWSGAAFFLNFPLVAHLTLLQTDSLFRELLCSTARDSTSLERPELASTARSFELLLLRPRSPIDPGCLFPILLLIKICGAKFKNGRQVPNRWFILHLRSTGCKYSRSCSGFLKVYDGWTCPPPSWSRGRVALSTRCRRVSILYCSTFLRTVWSSSGDHLCRGSNYLRAFCSRPEGRGKDFSWQKDGAPCESWRAMNRSFQRVGTKKCPRRSNKERCGANVHQSHWSLKECNPKSFAEHVCCWSVTLIRGLWRPITKWGDANLCLR